MSELYSCSFIDYESDRVRKIETTNKRRAAEEFVEFAVWNWDYWEVIDGEESFLVDVEGDTFRVDVRTEWGYYGEKETENIE